MSWQCKKCVSFAKHQMEVSTVEHSIAIALKPPVAGSVKSPCGC